MNLIEYHKKKNDLFADILIFFNKEPESFYMFSDEMIKRLKEISNDTAKMMNKYNVLFTENNST